MEILNGRGLKENEIRNQDVEYDRFTFKTFAASYYRQRDGNIIRG